ncbi:phosphotransferase-like protein [Deinococcus sp.]|uniref:phosphotransferase-like protein n=1 Tax=Deinococcus sp. TaxID=47478 RepID=UPI002869EC7A|nr:AAA family ATPase [Deinococcus sp.]
MRPISVILGSPAAGKRTVARALLRRFERGLHLPVDDLRHMVVSGLVDMGSEPSGALNLQLRLAREAAAHTASSARQGFAVVIDDFWQGDAHDQLFAQMPDTSPVRVLLRRSVEATLARLRGRHAAGDRFVPVLERVIHAVHAELAGHPNTGLHIIDSSHLSVEETVDQILAIPAVAR